MIPFAPHLAYECLEFLNCKTKNIWPEVKEDSVENVNFAIQINGKTRDIIKIAKDLSESDLKKMVQNNSKAKKYIEKNKIKKIIFVKNRIINYIV